MTFLQKKEEKNYTKNPEIQQQVEKERRSEETIHAHAEAVKNTKNAAGKTLNSLKEIFK